MDTSEGTTVYRSSIPYEAARINAAAVYCSDGRVGDQIDEFLHQGLGLPRYDRLACPGGPVALAGRLLAFWESRGVAEQLRFLVEVHEVREVVLIAHEGCAYYGERLHLDPAAAESEQRADLLTAASAVQRIQPTLEVAGFFARREEAAVAYELVFASKGLDLRLRALPPVVRAAAQAPVAPTSAPVGPAAMPAAPTSPLERLLSAAARPEPQWTSATRGRAGAGAPRTGTPGRR